jgi:hypothetical protein
LSLCASASQYSVLKLRLRASSPRRGKVFGREWLERMLDHEPLRVALLALGIGAARPHCIVENFGDEH